MARRLLFAALLAAGVAGCARRFPADAGGDRAVFSGAPVTFGPPGPLPAGTAVRWDFGDGARADGTPVVHAFARAGAFRVGVTVADAAGERTDVARVEVQRRPPLAAVPPSVALVLAFDRLVPRLPAYLLLAERLAGSDRIKTALGVAEMILGFDMARPESALRAGLDPDEGMALATFAGEPNALYVAVGVADESAAAATARRAIGRWRGSELRPGPHGSEIARTDDGEVHFLVDRGYLVIRLSTAANEDPAGLSAFRAAPDDGLLGRSAFVRARVKLTGSDVTAWVAPGVLVDADTDGSASPVQAVRRGLEGVVAAGVLTDAAVEVAAWAGVAGAAAREGLSEIFAPPPRSGGPLSGPGSAGPGGDAGSLLARAPVGAVGYLSLDAAPERLAELALGSPVSRSRDQAATRLRDRTGLDLESLLLLFDGGLEAAAYFDPAQFYQALAERRDPGEAAGFLVAAGVRDGPLAEKEVLRAIAARGLRPDVSRGPDGATYEVALGDRAGAAALRGRTLWLAAGPDWLRRALAEDEASPRLESEVRRRFPALASGHQLVYVDVARVVDAVRAPPEVPGVDRVQAALLRVAAAAFVEPFGPIRDAYAEMWVEADGVAGRASVRMR